MNKKTPISFNELKSNCMSDSFPFMKNVEEHIKKQVEMLNQLPFIITISSCQGHLPSLPDRKHCLMPYIWGIIKKDCISEFIEFVEKAKLHWFLNTPKHFVDTQMYPISKIRDGAFFRLQIPTDVGVEEGRRRLAKLAKIIKEKI